MGRQAYRVPMEFDAPLGVVWKGYRRNECGLSMDPGDDDHIDAGGCEGCRKIEPPAGPSWQLWETTTEGSPQSPVFATLDELAAWCEANATTFAHWTATAVQWQAMLRDDDIHHDEGSVRFI